MADEKNIDDLNDQGDYVSGAVGDDGKSVLVGKGLTQTSTENTLTVNLPPPPPPGHYGPNHPVREYTLADVVVALIGNPMTGAPGLVSQLTAMVIRLESIDKRQVEAHEERLKLLDDMRNVKHNQYSRAFQILVLSMAVVLIVFLVLILIRMPR